ncbi:MAG: mechanosensitive ion channel domain-containing protein [Candidatus Eisenbacteria bacterium]
MDSLAQVGSGDLPVLSLRTLIVVGGIIVAAFVARAIFRHVLLGHLKRLASRSETDIDDAVIRAIDRPIGILIFLIGVHIALSYLRIPEEPVDFRRFSQLTVLFLVTIDLTWLLIRLTDVFALFLQNIAQKTDSSLDDQLVPLIRKAIKVAIGILGFVLIIQNLGYKVTGLLAGLGIGGLALALAAQSTLANVFGSITILLDRPFAVGDLIKGEGFFGFVEEVGLRSTRIRQLFRTRVTVPNSVLANLTLENWGLLDSRRADFVVGVTYETTADQMEAAVRAIRGILEAREDIKQETIHVRFTDFGESSLNIKVIFITPTIDYGAFLMLQEEVNLAIMRAVERLGLEIAFPTRTVYLRTEEAKK